MDKEQSAYLEYELTDEQCVIIQFQNVNDRDGCHISLDMYKANLGPVTQEVATRIAGKFTGEIVTPF